MSDGIALFAVLVVLYCAVAVRLANWWVTMPMVFVAGGYLLGPDVLDLISLSPSNEVIHRLAEITLALLLFADASTLNLSEVRADPGLPARLLGFGLPLTLLAGAAVAYLLFSSEGLAFAALIGAMLAPTDAALGLPIFSNPRVPVRIRRALNLESGLNDGIATPFVTVFIAYATVTAGEHTSHWLVDALRELALAVVVAAGVGIIGGVLLREAVRRGWTSGVSEWIGVMGLAFSAFLVAQAIGGNGFVAAFGGGIIFGSITRGRFAEPTEFTEGAGTLLSLLVWGTFGLVLLTDAISRHEVWRPIAYAILSLTVVRMVPVATGMFGTRLRRDTVLLMGWFGPRGLASVVFLLLASREFEHVGRSDSTLIAVASWAILLSVLLHGLSATPLADWYGRRLETAGREIPEFVNVPELRERRSVVATVGRAGVPSGSDAQSGS